ncbi:hypothetical protein NX021_07700 [Cytobacillus firmus]|nr:hypothetical protein [Cytobacillus firmus]
MKEIDKFPKSTKKAVSYIKQDVIIEQLEEIRKLVIRHTANKYNA